MLRVIAAVINEFIGVKKEQKLQVNQVTQNERRVLERGINVRQLKQIRHADKLVKIGKNEKGTLCSILA